ncbi:DNA helicase-4 [Filomicrobium insigne]|uniref:DNA 3'-5' helicase n=1 Tax=Filomicrobium insigne TaxID=418854 RepID=A0A1H0N3E2_9HYPH|nr:UvrD-helicase domain-containing protein [Filomicrobium insigne]SDO87152.1 DNA helicase-4 [Filomicrobium insigne]
MSAVSHQIHRGPLTSALLSIIGWRFGSVKLTSNGIDLLGSTSRSLAFPEMAGPVYASRRLGFGALSIPLRDGSELKAVGFRPADIARFVESSREAWHRFVRAAFDEADDELRLLSQMMERLEQPRRYPAACLLDPFVERAQSLLSRLPEAPPGNVISVEQRRMFEAVVCFAQAPDQMRDKAISRFVATELAAMRDLFDTIETHPLTLEQRRAAVVDEDSTLVLAGAGSGKTSVIVAKAAYLIQRAIRQPGEILLLAFGRDAAEEMASRIEQRCGTSVDARTFHALGYEIIRSVEGQGPALAAHASDDRQYYALLRDILLNDIAIKDGSRELLLRWFTEFYRPYRSEWDFESEDEYNRYVRANELRTLNGEAVRSYEELKIANWLYINGIAYEYEPIYEHDLPENDRRAYTPDFRLTDSGIYIEHFGVRKERDANGDVRLTTAPYVDRDSYLEDMEWKRKIHKARGTTLIETFSYENVEGHLLSELKRKLEPFARCQPLPPEIIYSKLSRMGQVDAFTQTLGTFLRHFKSSDFTFENCRRRAAKNSDAPRELAFLKIFEPVMGAYEDRLDGKIDFEDMIRRATDHVREGRYSSPYRHLLIDEFQDISDGRAQLILALKAQHADTRIFAVGDDWQSIYRFAGSDIHLMRNFGQKFGGTFAGADGVHETVDLGRTFRSVDKIAHAAQRFVLRNPSQIEKQVVAVAASDNPAIRVVWHKREQEREALQAVLTNLANADGGSVLVLGRYRSVRPDDLSKLRSGHPQLAIDFKTVHGSKGLEADHVIILRATSGRMGFPSEIIDDSLLSIVLPASEPFEHAEERRLFYVALTRARKSVAILADKNNPSAFARELAQDARYGVVEVFI